MILLKRMLCLVAAATALVLIFGWWSLGQTKHVPDFYAEATVPSVQQDDFAARQMLAGVQQLQDDAAKIGSWQAIFSDRQINAWLENELPQKFPRLLAKGARDPRVVIRDGKLLAAARYQRGRIDTVVSCELDVQLTEEPNILALRIKNLRAGALPIPLDQFLGPVSREAAMGDVNVQWDQTEDGPVALFRVPSEHPSYAVSPVIVECIDLTSGALILTGHSGPLAESTYRPHGPLHDFVSFQPSDRTRISTGSRWR